MKQGSNSRRSRGRGNGKRPQKNHNFDSAGPEGRVRGNAQQVYEKYLALARDAMASGDRIATENYFQHAEHYLRVLMAQDNSDGRVDAFRRRQRFGPFGMDEFDEQGAEGDDENTPAENRASHGEARPQGEGRSEGSDLPREASDRETTGRQGGGRREGSGRDGSGNGRRVPIERSNDAPRGEAKAVESDGDGDDEGLRRTLAL